MALDRFINIIRSEVAKNYDLKTDAEIDAFFIGMEESAKDNQEALEKRDKMLRDAIAELCEAKRLLEATINDIYKECSCNTCGCDICEYSRETCDYDDRFTWRHKAAVLKLIGEANDEP